MLIIGLCLVLCAVLIPAAPLALRELTGGGIPAATAVIMPAARYILEPMTGFAEYVQGFSRYNLQLLSWVAWITAGAMCFSLLQGRSRGSAAIRAAAAVLGFLTMVVVSLLVPWPAGRLKAPAEWQVIDLHTHTWHSYDAVNPPWAAAWYHRRLGFDAFFVTEQNHTRSAPSMSGLSPSVMAGIQLKTAEGTDLLVLSSAPYSADLVTGRSISAAVAEAHRRGFVVLCPHWWRSRGVTWQVLADAGVDGFEIYNPGYRLISEHERSRLIAFCVRNALIMVGSSDWHGWGWSGGLWTLVKTGSGEKKEAIISALRERAPTRVLVRDRIEATSTARFVFEPFAWIWYYAGSMNAYQVGGWLFWLAVLWLIGRITDPGALLRHAMLVAGAASMLCGVLSIAVWATLAPDSDALVFLLAPVMGVLGAGWLAVFAWFHGRGRAA